MVDNFLTGIAGGLERGARLSDLRNQRKIREAQNRRAEAQNKRLQAEADRAARAARRDETWRNGAAGYMRPDGTTDWDGLIAFTRTVNPDREADVRAMRTTALQNRAGTRADAQGQRYEDALQKAIAGNPGGVPTAQDLQNAAAAAGNLAGYTGMGSHIAQREKDKQAEILRQAMGAGYKSGGAPGMMNAAALQGDVGAARAAMALGSEVAAHSNEQRDRYKQNLGERMMSLYRGAGNNFGAVAPIFRNEVRQNLDFFAEELGLPPGGPRRVIDVEMKTIDGERRFTPVIQNSQTGTTGPMTIGASPDGSDVVLSMSEGELVSLFQSWSGNAAAARSVAGAGGGSGSKPINVPGNTRWLYQDGQFIPVPDADAQKAMETLDKLYPTGGLAGSANEGVRREVALLAKEMSDEGYPRNESTIRLAALMDPKGEYMQALASADTPQEKQEVYEAVLIAARGKMTDSVGKDVASIASFMMGEKGGPNEIFRDVGQDLAEAAEKMGYNVNTMTKEFAELASQRPETIKAFKAAYAGAKSKEDKEQVLRALMVAGTGINLSENPEVVINSGASGRPRLPEMPRRPVPNTAAPSLAAPAVPTPTGTMPRMPRPPGSGP